MKISVRILLNLLMLALLAFPADAQQNESADSDSVRTKIEQLENADIKSKSKLVQDIYKQTLARLYKEYIAILSQDVADLKKIQSAAQSDPQREIASQVEKFSNEINVTTEKLKTIQGGVQSSAAENGSAATVRETAQGPAESPSVSDNDSLRSSFVRATSSSDGSNLTAPAASMTVNSVTSPASPAAPPPGPVTLCGQIKPASLVEIWAQVESNPALLNSVIAAMTLTEFNKAKHSAVSADCVHPDPDLPLGASLKAGDQKNAVVKVLHQLIAQLNANPKLEGSVLPLGARRTIERQILLLNGFIGNALVHIKTSNLTPNLTFTPVADKDGNYKIDLAKGSYTVSTEADNDNTTRNIEIQGDEGSVRLDLPIEDRPVSLLTRAFVGYEQAGAAAAKHEQNFFFDLFISKSFPFRQKIDPDFGERLRTWVDFRFGSVPQSGEATLGEFTSGFATQVSSLKVKDVARVFEFLGGLEYRLTGNSALLPSFDRQTKQKFSMSLIAGAGVTTPTNPLESISTFKVTPGALGLPALAEGKDFVSFIQSDRDRFFRQYYVGLRMQTFFFNLFNMPLQRFPTQLDIAVGQNEFVTGGSLRGPVVRIDGFVPLPYDRLKFINLFATAMLRPGRAVTGIPLVLQPAPDGTLVPAPNVALIALPQPNRDYYRVGFGIDLMSLIQMMSQKK